MNEPRSGSRHSKRRLSTRRTATPSDAFTIAESTYGPAQGCERGSGFQPRVPELSVNVGNAVSSGFVVRDSAQVATRIRQPECGPDFTNTLGRADTPNHCGGTSI
jgi:hypothetical protein